MYKRFLLTCLFVVTCSVTLANEVEIVMVKMKPSSLSGDANTWTFMVTLKHEDTGWEHYADGWRVVDEKGKELAYRTLYHPHEHEQPFERGLSGIRIPAGTRIIYVEAHDKVHKWSKQRVKIDLSKPTGDRYQIITRQ
jgi:hypothetical protein